jgi:hypothetical protein
MVGLSSYEYAIPAFISYPSDMCIIHATGVGQSRQLLESILSKTPWRGISVIYADNSIVY